MKGFVTKGLLLLALGMLIAGCAGPSQENSVSSSKNGDLGGIPMVLDPANHTLTIGDGSGGYVTTAGGHTVEVVNGSTTAAVCVNDGSGNSDCWIRLYNRDSKYYMANAFVVATACASCTLTNHTFDNFDGEHMNGIAGGTCWDAAGNPRVIAGCTVHIPTTAAGANTGGPTPLVGGGIAYAADYSFPELAGVPANPFGAPMEYLQGTNNIKARWMIAPKCGFVSQMWDFGGTDLTLFPFWATVKASWFRMNPMGADGVRGGGDDDSRFDFQNFTTVFLTLTDLKTAVADSAWRKMYRPGTVYRSNVLAGYKPTWAAGVSGNDTADINLTGLQKYFAVNVGIESSDRMETKTFGLKSDPHFEYYQQIAILTSWNPRILTHMTAPASGWGLTKAGGSYFQNKANSLCQTQVGCDDDFGTNHAIDVPFDGNATAVGSAQGALVTAGYIGTTSTNPMINNGTFWSYFTTAQSYNWENLATNTSNNVPAGGVGTDRMVGRKFAMRGFTKIRCLTANDATCIQPDGADPEPEIWLYNFILKVQTGTVGQGSEIKVETHSGFTSIQIYRSCGLASCPTPNTFDQSGQVPPSNSTDAGPNRDAIDAFTLSAGSTVVISAGLEAFNSKIKHRGPVKATSIQAWDVGVCIK